MPLYSSWIHGVTARQGVADPAAAGGLAGAVDLHAVARTQWNRLYRTPLASTAQNGSPEKGADFKTS
jgi:hypothetical protein